MALLNRQLRPHAPEAEDLVLQCQSGITLQKSSVPSDPLRMPLTVDTPVLAAEQALLSLLAVTFNVDGQACRPYPSRKLLGMSAQAQGAVLMQGQLAVHRAFVIVIAGLAWRHWASRLCIDDVRVA